MVIFQGVIIGEFYLLLKNNIFKILPVNMYIYIYYLHNLGFKYYFKVFLEDT